MTSSWSNRPVQNHDKTRTMCIILRYLVFGVPACIWPISSVTASPALWFSRSDHPRIWQVRAGCRRYLPNDGRYSRRITPFYFVYEPKCHVDVMTWKRFPHYRPFVRGIHRLLLDYPRKGLVTQNFDFVIVHEHDVEQTVELLVRILNAHVTIVLRRFVRVL